MQIVKSRGSSWNCFLAEPYGVQPLELEVEAETWLGFLVCFLGLESEDFFVSFFSPFLDSVDS